MLDTCSLKIHVWQFKVENLLVYEQRLGAHTTVLLPLGSYIKGNSL